MGINLEILMFLHSKMNAVKMIKKNVWTCRTLILLTLIFFYCSNFQENGCHNTCHCALMLIQETP